MLEKDFMKATIPSASAYRSQHIARKTQIEHVASAGNTGNESF